MLNTKKTVRCGLDRLGDSGFKELAGLRFGLIANPSSVDSKFQHAIDLLFHGVDRSAGKGLVRLFGPEHGLRGALQDMVGEHDFVDSQTGLPVVSLYGNSERSLAPRPEHLQDLDAIVFDLQDIGCRYYTFAQTLAYVMEVAKTLAKRVIVLDRVNPIGGELVEGALLEEACISFCGYFPFPNRHGLTVGELATLMNSGLTVGSHSRAGIGCDLQVVPVEGWERSRYIDELITPWVLPSPNMPSCDTSVVYPGTCLLEATNLSEGRGTTKPFEIIGAPFLNGEKWAEATLAQGFELKGVVLRPLSFIPKFSKWADKLCGGVQIHVTDRAQFQPFRTGLALLSAAAQVAPLEFSWRAGAYEFIDNTPAIDLLYGSSAFRQTVEKKHSLTELLPAIQSYEQTFTTLKRAFHLY